MSETAGRPTTDDTEKTLPCGCRVRTHRDFLGRVLGTVLARGPRCGDARHTVDAPVIMPGREHASPDGGGLLS